MKKIILAGLSVVLLFGFLASCATAGSSAENQDFSSIPRDDPNIEKIEDLLEKWKDENISFVLDRDGNMHLLVSIVFRANYADFVGLSPEILANNAVTLDHVAEILHMLTDYNIRIEGHANPTTPPGPQREREEPELMILSEQRALRVVNELGRLGVPLDRKTVLGFGGRRTLYDYTDSVNSWKNRRVEFILYKRAN